MTVHPRSVWSPVTAATTNVPGCAVLLSQGRPLAGVGKATSPGRRRVRPFTSGSCPPRPGVGGPARLRPDSERQPPPGASAACPPCPLPATVGKRPERPWPGSLPPSPARLREVSVTPSRCWPGAEGVRGSDRTAGDPGSNHEDPAARESMRSASRPPRPAGPPSPGLCWPRVLGHQRSRNPGSGSGGRPPTEGARPGWLPSGGWVTACPQEDAGWGGAAQQFPHAWAGCRSWGA